jgi:hypothetical protein
MSSGSSQAEGRAGEARKARMLAVEGSIGRPGAGACKRPFVAAIPRYAQGMRLAMRFTPPGKPTRTSDAHEPRQVRGARSRW